jgi:catechol 2,3-dioxygenase
MVRLQVADLARSVAYYQHVLGLALLNATASRATLAGHGDSTPLIELNELPGAAAAPPLGRLGLYHFALLLPSRAALAHFVRHLSSIGARAAMSDHLVSEAVYLTDPDGLGIEVYADRPRASWRMDGPALAMDTIPLDLADLLRTAPAQPWTGMPAGTRIGHVHLHVGDLAGSASFYHEGLGLDRIVLQFPGALFMSAGGYHHHLGTNTWAARAPRAGTGEARLLEWTLHVPSDTIAAAAASIEAAGGAVEWDDDRRTFAAADPWGTRVRIVYGLAELPEEAEA